MGPEYEERECHQNDKNAAGVEHFCVAASLQLQGRKREGSAVPGEEEIRKVFLVGGREGEIPWVFEIHSVRDLKFEHVDVESPD